MHRPIVLLFACCLALPALALSSGTGFFVSNEGHILTNAHVIDGVNELLVGQPKGLTYRARVLQVDKVNDLALIQINASSRPLHVRGVNGVEKGSKVYTLGFPNPSLQGTEAKYTEGVISSFSGLGNASNVMQVTVPIQPGNSGGPLFDDRGNVIGVIVAKLDALAVLKNQEYLPENVSYAVKSDHALPLLRGIAPTRRGTPRSVNQVSEVESSVVLILGLSAEESVRMRDRLSKTVPAPNFSGRPDPDPAPAVAVPSAPAPVLPTSPAPLATRPDAAYVARQVSIVTPQSVENACIVPVSFRITPSLRAGEKARLLIEGQPVSTVQVQRGRMRAFGQTLRLTGDTTFSVDCPGCEPTSKFLAVPRGCFQAEAPTAIGEMRVRTNGVRLLSLIQGSFPAAEVDLWGSSLAVRATLSPASSNHPLLIVDTEAPLTYEHCVQIRTASDSKEKCS